MHWQAFYHLLAFTRFHKSFWIRCGSWMENRWKHFVYKQRRICTSKKIPLGTAFISKLKETIPILDWNFSANSKCILLVSNTTILHLFGRHFCYMWLSVHFDIDFKCNLGFKGMCNDQNFIYSQTVLKSTTDNMISFGWHENTNITTIATRILKFWNANIKQYAISYCIPVQFFLLDLHDVNQVQADVQAVTSTNHCRNPI